MKKKKLHYREKEKYGYLCAIISDWEAKQIAKAIDGCTFEQLKELSHCMAVFSKGK